MLENITQGEGKKIREEMLKNKREEREALKEKVVLPPSEKKKLEEISKN